MAYFLNGVAKPYCSPPIPQPLHRIIALFDSPVLLLYPAIEIRVAAVEDLLSERLAKGARRGPMPIRGDALRSLPPYR